MIQVCVDCKKEFLINNYTLDTCYITFDEGHKWTDSIEMITICPHCNKVNFKSIELRSLILGCLNHLEI